MEILLELPGVFLIYVQQLVHSMTEKEAELSGADIDSIEGYKLAPGVLDIARHAPFRQIRQNTYFSGEHFGSILHLVDRNGDATMIRADLEEFLTLYTEWVTRNIEWFDKYHYYKVESHTPSYELNSLL